MDIKLRKNYKKFGNLQINLVDLYDGKLKVLYITSSPYPKAKTQTVSDDLQSLLIDIIDTEGTNEINRTIVGRLSEKERNLFHMLLKDSGLVKDLKYKTQPRTIAETVERFKVLQGSILAGNDNQEVINECINVIKILVVAGKLDAREANDIITEFTKE